MVEFWAHTVFALIALFLFALMFGILFDIIYELECRNHDNDNEDDQD